VTPNVSAVDVWVVVVSWNGAKLLPACLDALDRQTVPARVVVVDNASDDPTHEVVARSRGVTLVPLAWNCGFAEASNVGIRRALDAGARFVALVNPDVVLEPDWIERLVAAAESHPEAGLFGGLLVFTDDPSRVNSTGLEMDVLGRVRDRDFGVDVASLARSDGPVSGATGGAVLLRAAALGRIGLLDPVYFAYYEDADLSMRARRAGVGVRYVATARARHGFGKSIGAGSARQRYLLARNHLRFVAAHLPVWRALPIVLAVPALRAVVKAPLELVRGRPAHALAQLRASSDGLVAGVAALAARLARGSRSDRSPSAAR
jgi:GT2 family glycosyltransferase